MKKILVVLFCFLMTLHLPVFAAGLQDNIEFTPGSSGFYLTVNLDGSFAIKPGDRISAMMLAPGTDSFEEAGPEDIIYADACVVSDTATPIEFSHDLGSSSGGACRVKVTWTDGILTSDAEYAFVTLTPVMNEEMLQAFVNVDAEDFAEVYELYVVENGWLIVDDIPECSDSSYAQGLGASFVLVRDGAKDGVFSSIPAQITGASEIKQLLKASILADRLQNGNNDQIKDAVSKYSSILPELIFKDLPLDRFLDIYRPQTFESAQDMVKATRIASALALIKDGTYADVENALKTYAQDLGVDLDAISEAGLSLAAIAKEIDTSVPDSYQDGLADEIAAIIKELTGGSGSSSRPSGGGSGGGSGGSSGGGSYANSPVTVPVTQPESSDDSQTGSGETAATGFQDMDGYDWAKDAVNALYSAGIIQGIDAEHFEPGRAVTRAEFVKLLTVGCKVTAEAEAYLSFSDCSQEDWFYPYVQNATAAGIIEGNGSSFEPFNEITREDVAVMLTRLTRWLNFSPKELNEIQFNDSDYVSEYAKNGVTYAASIGLFQGRDDGNFMPKDSLTRAEAAVLVHRAILLFGMGEV